MNPFLWIGCRCQTLALSCVPMLRNIYFNDSRYLNQKTALTIEIVHNIVKGTFTIETFCFKLSYFKSSLR
jgi:hypothetical protein